MVCVCLETAFKSTLRYLSNRRADYILTINQSSWMWCFSSFQDSFTFHFLFKIVTGRFDHDCIHHSRNFTFTLAKPFILGLTSFEIFIIDKLRSQAIFW